MEKLCALCNNNLRSAEFNLKSTNTLQSRVPLLSLVEDIVGALLTSHLKICLQCYNLIIELDIINTRQREIHSQFKKYVENLERNATLLGDAIKHESSENEDINNVENSVNSEAYCMKSSNSIESITKNTLLPEKPPKTDLECTKQNLQDSSKSNDSVGGKDISQREGKDAVAKKVRKKLRDNIKLHKCDCSKMFRTIGELKSHMKSHNNYRPFICEICGQSYKHKSSFNIHMDMHKGINPFMCVYCNKSFTQKAGLVRHVPIHTGEMPYQCDQCGKRFVHHSSFNIHRLSHSGQKSFKCSLCGLALFSGSHLKRHMRIHTGEKNFACNTCGKRFAERYNLVVHEKLHNNMSTDVPVKKKYSCQICGESFNRKLMLNDHLTKIHETMKPKITKEKLKMVVNIEINDGKVDNKILRQ